jgi:hypothetical protein
MMKLLKWCLRKMFQIVLMRKMLSREVSVAVMVVVIVIAVMVVMVVEVLEVVAGEDQHVVVGGIGVPVGLIRLL